MQQIENEKSEMEDEKIKMLEDAESLRKEQEDLLVLLADQDTKISTYRKRLKELGETVSLKHPLKVAMLNKLLSNISHSWEYGHIDL